MLSSGDEQQFSDADLLQEPFGQAARTSRDRASKVAILVSGLVLFMFLLVPGILLICARTGFSHILVFTRSQDLAVLAEDKKQEFQCLGKVKVSGYHDVELIPEGWKMSGPDADNGATFPGHVKILEGGNRFTIHHKSRVYFGEKCTPGEYNPLDYTNLQLLGKKFRFTANIKGTQCGCNAAMYFTPMHQNTGFKNRAGSYYCDANFVGAFTWGKKEEGCQEIDVLEGNQYAMHSTLHAWGEKQEGTPENGYIQVWKSIYDHDGLSGGNGGGMGGGNGPRSFKNEQFCPGSATIDTTKEFEMVAYFFEKGGKFDRFLVEIRQGDRNLTAIDTWWDREKLAKHGAFNLNDHNTGPRLHANPYKYGYEAPQMDDLTRVLKGGVTPIFSFWSSKTMDWMDGPGTDGLGPCKEETLGCDNMDISFGGVAIEDI